MANSFVVSQAFPCFRDGSLLSAFVRTAQQQNHILAGLRIVDAKTRTLQPQLPQPAFQRLVVAEVVVFRQRSQASIHGALFAGVETFVPVIERVAFPVIQVRIDSHDQILA